MAIGGFNGSDPSPTLAQFQQWVAEGKIHYFIAQGSRRLRRRRPERRRQHLDADQYLGEDTFTATTVDGVTVYDLTAS